MRPPPNWVAIALGVFLGNAIGISTAKCTKGLVNRPLPPQLLQGEFLLSTKDKVTTETVDGCQYLLLQGTITHKGNCSNPIHLRGGALLEDWSGR